MQGHFSEGPVNRSALRPASEPSHSNLAPSTSALMRRAPPILAPSWHRSPSPVPRKWHKKQCAERGHSPVPKKDKRGVTDEVRPVPGHLSSPKPPPRVPSRVWDPSLSPRSCRGTLCLRAPSTPEAFQAATDLMAPLVLPTPRDYPLTLESLKAAPSRGKPPIGPL